MGLRPDSCQRCGRTTMHLKYCRKCRLYVCSAGMHQCWAGSAYDGYCIGCDLKIREERNKIVVTVQGRKVYADGITCGSIRGERGNYRVYGYDGEEKGGPFVYHKEAAAFARTHFAQ